MTTNTKTFVMTSFAIVGALAVLIAAWITNGSEREDLWLYIFSVWLVLYGGLEAYFQWKKGKAK